VDERTQIAEDDPRVGTVLGGRYRIVRVLGAGGMGVVYRGEHVHMHKPVAIKVLHPQMTAMPEIVARFEREAVAAGRIQHPNVATATDFGKLEDGSFYLALEYVEGKSLGSVVKQGALGAPRALLIARQIAEGLGAAHAAGIVHRDLKPDNVQLVTKDGVADWVKLLDFGIAKLHLDEAGANQPLTQVGSVFGTPEYMSPEQAQGHAVDHRADLYALGVITYEMVSGKIPFDADDVVVLITRHVTQPPPPLPSSVPAGVQAFIFDLLAKKPEDRPQTAAEVVLRIDRLLADPSVAPRGSLPPRAASAIPELARVKAVARKAARKAVASVVPALSRRVRIGRLDAPLGAVALVASGFVLVGMVLALLFLRRDRAPGEVAGAPAAASVAPSAAPAVDTARRQAALILRAESGDEAALKELEALPEKTAESTRALGRGRCQRSEMVACMNAYKAGIQSYTRLRQDPIVLADVRSAAEHELAYETAMRLAAHQLGSGGLDVLWDTWTKTRKGEDVAAINRRARAFLDDSAVRNNASRELTLVLELERAEKRRRCSEAERLIERVTEYGDARTLPILERFNTTRGCGLLDLGDCWGCLRSGRVLAQARDAAKGRPGPTFVLP